MKPEINGKVPEEGALNPYEIGNGCGARYHYHMGFRGKKKEIVKLLEAMLDRASNESISGRMYAYEIVEGSPDGKKKLSWHFEKLDDNALAHYVSGGTFCSAANGDIYALEEVFHTHFQELLTLAPALEGCIWVLDASYEEGIEIPYDIYYYSEADSNEAIRQYIKTKAFRTDEDAFVEEEEEEDAFMDEWDGMIRDYELVPVKPEILKEQFLLKLGREESYFHKLLDTESTYELLPSYTKLLRNTSLDSRPERIEQLSIGDSLYLCNATGERDDEVGIGAPCIAVCNTDGALGVLGTGISETLLAEVAGLDLEEGEEDDNNLEINHRLQEFTTVTVTAVKPLSKMRTGSKRPTLEVEITISESLLASYPSSNSPVLNEYRRRLLEKYTGNF